MYKNIIRLLCWLGIHNQIVSRKFSNETRQVSCPNCKKKWAMNDRVLPRRLIPWDSAFEEFYKNA